MEINVSSHMSRMTDTREDPAADPNSESKHKDRTADPRIETEHMPMTTDLKTEMNHKHTAADPMPEQLKTMTGPEARTDMPDNRTETHTAS